MLSTVKRTLVRLREPRTPGKQQHEEKNALKGGEGKPRRTRSSSVSQPVPEIFLPMNTRPSSSSSLGVASPPTQQQQQQQQQKYLSQSARTSSSAKEGRAASATKGKSSSARKYNKKSNKPTSGQATTEADDRAPAPPFGPCAADIDPIMYKEFTTILDCSKKVPTSYITYRTVATTISSWENGILKIPNWPQVAGELFLRKIFELEPATIQMFGFDTEKTKFDDPDLCTDRQFMGKAVRLIRAIDIAIGLLGPDLQPLENELREIGKRHAAMDCRPEHWPMVGQALFYVFERCMLTGFTRNERECWTLVYNFLGYFMIQGLYEKRPELKNTSPASFARPSFPPETASSSHTLHDKEQRKEQKRQGRSSTDKDNNDGYYNCHSKRKEPYYLSLDCKSKVPLSAMKYEQVQIVVSTWDVIIKRIPQWDLVTGESFLRNIIRRDPTTCAMFGLCQASTADVDGTKNHHPSGASDMSDTSPSFAVRHDDPTLAGNRKFMSKARLLIKAIDMAIGFLGPDLTPLESELFELGIRHSFLECRPRHWPIVGAALFDVFSEHMGENGKEFTNKVQEAWTVVYNFFSYHMIRGLVHQRPELAKEYICPEQE